MPFARAKCHPCTDCPWSPSLQHTITVRSANKERLWEDFVVMEKVILIITCRGDSAVYMPVCVSLKCLGVCVREMERD